MRGPAWREVARYRTAVLSRHRVRSKRAALAFVNQLGFCYAFTSGPGGLPGLFDVLATRSIDRMWEWAWLWKDELATAKKLAYGKIICGKPTYLSLDFVPYFFTLSGNMGKPDDYLQAYWGGRLSLLARDIYEHVREHGPCSTWMLRKRFVRRGERGTAFHRALADLQRRLLIGKAGESAEGSYSFNWDTFDRWLPQAVQLAATISTVRAASMVLERYLRTCGAALAVDPIHLFAWPPGLLADAERALEGTISRVPVDGDEALVHTTLLGWLRRRTATQRA
jgi:hypothetical protein